MHNKIEEILKDKISDSTDVEPEDIKNETSLESLDLDSLDYVAMQLEVRKQTKVQINIHELKDQGVSTFGELVDAICEQCTNK